MLMEAASAQSVVPCRRQDTQARWLHRLIINVYGLFGKGSASRAHNKKNSFFFYVETPPTFAAGNSSASRAHGF